MQSINNARMFGMSYGLFSFPSGCRMVVFAMLFQLAFTSGSLAQAYAEPTRIIPQSPNTTSFQKFGNSSVSAYTGVPNISIPIYMITSRDISHQISISYNASGIRVAEEASRVGLGWSLVAGGVITRTVMGMDDFQSRPDAYHAAAVPDLNIGDVSSIRNSNLNMQGDNGQCSVIPPYNSEIRPHLEGYIDFEPDLYKFNFGAYSGSFYLKRNKEAVLLNQEKVTVAYLASNGGSFEIKTPDGFTYLFSEKEDYIDYFSPFSSGAPVVNAWHLTKIISAKGEELYFDYQNISGGRIQVPGAFFQTGFPTEVISGPIQCGLEGRVMFYYNTPAKEYSKLLLSQIRFNHGTIVCHYSSRLDLQGDAKLDSLQLIGVSQGRIRSWVFNYDYFDGVQDENRTNVGTFDTRSKRLKLLSLAERTRNGQSLPPHTFLYNSSIPGVQKTSFAVDHWGFFNGKMGRFDLIPDMVANFSNDPTSRIMGTFGTSRDADPAYNQMYLLNEIKYPTGGRTVFEFESNDFDIEKSMVNDYAYNNDEPEIVAKQITKMYPGKVYYEQPTSAQTAAYILDLTDMAVDPDDVYPTQLISLKAFFRYDGSPQQLCIASGAATVTLCREDGSVIAQSDVASALGNTNKPMTTCAGPPPQTPGGTVNYYGASFSNDYNLPPGKYIWKLQIGSNGSHIQDVHLTIDYLAVKIQQNIVNNGVTLAGAAFGGGLRVKRISDYSELSSTPTNVRRYQYATTSVNGVSRSYGRRMARPIYGYFSKKHYASTCMGPGPGQEVNFHTWTRVVQSEAIYPLQHDATGASTGYDSVIVYYGENGENGKTLYVYENQPHLLVDYSVQDYIYTEPARIPRKPPAFGAVQNYGNGNLLDEIDYKNDGQAFVPVSKVSNVYNEFQPSRSAVYAVERRQLEGVLPATCQFEAVIYPLFVKTRKLLVATTDSTYGSVAGSGSFGRRTDFAYDHSSHLQMLLKSTSDSKGRTETIRFKYPLDYAISEDDTGTAGMKSAHMHALPVVEERTIQDGGGPEKITELVINKFAINAPSNRVVLSEIARLDTAKSIDRSTFPVYQPVSGTYPSGVVPKYKLSKYDAQGNLLESQKTSDVLMSYIWDYAGAFPIAEITNASQQDVAYTSFESSGAGNWSGITPTNIFQNASLTGNKAYNQSGFALSRTGLTASKNYVLSYWSRNGAYSVPGTIAGYPKAGLTAGGWTYYEHIVQNRSSVSISGSGYIDELRLYPQQAQMRTFTYDPLIGQTGECAADNAITYYEYDEAGRLGLIRDKDKNIVKKYCYNYAGQPEVCYGVITFSSEEKSGSFSRSNCPAGGVSVPVTYTVPKGTYISTLSQQVADQMAQDDVTANGQAYADSVGSCQFSSIAKSGTFTRQFCPDGGVGGAYVYTVDAGRYTSTINQQAADDQAQNDVNVNGQTVANTQGPCTYSNDPFSRTLQRKNCPSGTLAGSATYVVAAGKHTSTVSKLAANQLAQADLDANTQTYVDSAASCSAIPCDFSMSGGYENLSSSFNSYGSTVYFGIAFNAQSTLSMNIPYQLGYVNGSCVPSATRTFSVTGDSHQFQVTVNNSGSVTLYITSGGSLSGNESVSGTYTK